jgi:hypothetical protein
MDTVELENCVQEYDFLHVMCLGIFSADALPSGVAGFPACLIVNTHPSSKPGEHWVAFFMDSKKRLEYFDSYGRDVAPNSYFEKFADVFETKSFNKMRLQGPFSAVCGYYCLSYIFYRCLGYSLNQFLSLFSKENYHENDHNVKDVVDYFFHIVKSIYTNEHLNQICRALGH